ncbi:MAG: hypothetical protein JNL21_39425 [Myxococcales bacterium]|nr:hypothetical protein [Myxococcales bacterium]
MAARIISVVCVSAAGLLGCASSGANPAEQPPVEQASTEPKPAAPPIENASAAPVAWQPAPIVGAPIGSELVPSIRIESAEGIDTARANAALGRAAAAARECAGAGTVVHVRMKSGSGKNDFELDPSTVLDQVQRGCVLDALSTVRFSNEYPAGEHLRTADRYSVQFVLSW